MKLERRDFLKIAAVSGASAVIALYTSDIRDIFTNALDDKKHIIWLQGASDSGCTISFLQGVNPDLIDVVNNFRLSIDFHPNLMVPSGYDAVKALDAARLGTTSLDLLIIEGAIPHGIYCTVGEANGSPAPVENWVKSLGVRAKSIIAVGTCAAFGGIPAAAPNPTGSRSVSQVLGYSLASGRVINIPGCPSHPDWITLTLAAALSGQTVQLDSMGRPTAFFREDERVHEHCRLEEQSDDRYATDFGQQPPSCLYELGCKAKDRDEVNADCTERLWNNKTNVCMYAGAPCIGCVAPTFPDGMSPFFKKTSERERTELTPIPSRPRRSKKDD